MPVLGIRGMRLLILTQYFWPENFIINDIAKGLRERGRQVEVLTGKPNYPEGKIYDGYGVFGQARDDYEGIRIYRVPLIPRGKSRGWNLLLNYLSFAFSASVYIALFARKKYDRIFVFQPSPITCVIPALVARLLYKTPVILLIQDLWPESLSATGAIKSKAVLRVVGSIVSFLLERVDTILVQSRAFIPKLVGKGLDSSKIFYFPDYADNIFTATPHEPMKNRLSDLPKGFKILFAGNIGESQDFDTILKAAEILKDEEGLQWVILGDGRKKRWVENKIREKGLQGVVYLLGKFPLEDMPSFYSSADAMLVTLKNEEIFSLTIPGKVQPYMACSKPILAALNGEGGKIILEAGAGAVSPAGDYQQLAKCALYLKNLPASELAKMGRNGRKYYEENFSRERLLEKLDGFIRA